MSFKLSFISIFLIVSVSLIASEKPNVIVILSDDQGYADAGFQEIVAPDVKTPCLDKLAKSAAVFRNAYAASPICSTSRLALSTGRYQQRWGGYYYGQGGLPTSEQTIAEMMLEAGYRTMKVGKTHLNNGPKQDPMKHGFEKWLGFIHHSWDFHLISDKDVAAYEKRKKGSSKSHRMSPIGPLTRNSESKESFEGMTTTDVFRDESIKFIKEESEKPFYLQLEFNAVHTIMTRPPNKEYADKYGIPMRPFDRNASKWEFPHWDPDYKGGYKKWYSDVAHLKVLDPYGRKIYLAYLEQMDAAIGKIMDTLEKQGIAENTIVFFSSDNGGSHQSYANNGKLNAYKYCVMDGGIKVPMLLSWPKKFKHSKIDSIVTHRDVFATLSEVTGVKPKKALDGKSLLPLVEGKVKNLHTEPVFWDAAKAGWCVRHGKWKLVNIGAKTYTDFEIDENGLVTKMIPTKVIAGLKLYDLDADPGETKNLIEKYPEIGATMEKQYKEWRSQMGDPVRGSKKK